MKALHKCSKSRIMLSNVTPYDKKRLKLVWWWWLNYNYYLGYMQSIIGLIFLFTRKQIIGQPLECYMWLDVKTRRSVRMVVIQCGATKHKYLAKVSFATCVILSFGMCRWFFNFSRGMQIWIYLEQGNIDHMM